jgi:D-alanine---(R)-lactate ligase
MDRSTLGIIFGGAGEEHPVSVKSAREVAKYLDLQKYEPFWIGITTDGAWKLCAGPEPGWESDAGPAVVVSPDRRTHGLMVGPDRRTVRLDVAFPLLHGRFGEDGAIQGLLELAGIPYVGCDVASSALCLDKSLTYLVARDAGIATPDHWVVAADDKTDAKVDVERLPYPVFVKPARSGSSFGVSKVTGPDELPAALDDARAYDTKVLIEAAVAGREIGCAVLEDPFGLVLGEVDQVALSHGFFRIHQEASPESGSENSEFIVPAAIDDASRRLVRESAETLYRALGCRGLARVDLFLTDEGQVVLNEVNTMPGMTSYSRFPRMMAAAGVPLPEVLDRLLATARRGKER